MIKGIQITKKDILDIIRVALKEQDKRLDKKFADQDMKLEKRFIKHTEDIQRWFGVVLEQQDHDFKLMLESTIGLSEGRLKDMFKEDFIAIAGYLEEKVSHREFNVLELRVKKLELKKV